MNPALWKRIAFAVGTTFLALMAGLLLFPDVLGTHHPFGIFLISAALSAWYGGFAGGLLALALGYLAAEIYFIEPIGSLALPSTENFERGMLFLLVGCVVIFLFELQHRSRRHSAYLASILSSSDDAIISQNLQGVITAWNNGAERLFGYTAKEAAGQPALLIVPPERHDEEADLLQRVLRGESNLHRETVRQTRDGRRLAVAVTYSPFYDAAGGMIGISKISRDITGQKKLEQALREEREWLAVTLASIGDSVIATDRGGAIRFLNAKAEAMTGWTQDEALGRPLEEIFRAIDEDTRAPKESPVRQAVASRRPVGPANHTLLLARGGGECPIEDIAAPIVSPQGDVLGVVLVFHDVARHRHLENRLHQKADILMERDQRKDEFIAMLAHELRNPLAPISNALHIMQSSAPADERMRREAVAIAGRQVSHMVRLLDDLLDVSRITHGKIALQSERLDLRAAIRTAIDSAAPLINERGHALDVRLPEAPAWVTGDATRLAQLFGNLLNNAAKYSDCGGRITLTLHDDGGEVAVSVADTGIGIADSKLPYIFDMFMQVDNAAERTQGGMGIGLMLVRKIAQLHGGSVEAYSEGKGRGTVFTVRLPAISREEKTMNETPHTQETPSAYSYRILVTDDNEASANTLGWTLELLGHELQVAYNGRQALELAASFRPDIVLLDIGMPDMDGYELCRRMRGIDALKHAVMIAQTGWGQQQHVQRAREAGFDHHLTKPVNIDTLQALLDKIHAQQAGQPA